MKTHLYALTPNPALDLSGHVCGLVPNEKNHVSHTRLDPGGNGINAARIANRLGLQPQLLGFLGGAAGMQVRQLLESEGLHPRFTPIKGTTRTNVTVTNDLDHLQTRLTFPGPRVSADELNALFKRLTGLKPPGIFILGGSLPEALTAEFYSRCITNAQRAGLGVVLDIPALPLAVVLRQLRARLLLIKPNQAELEEQLGRSLRGERALIQAARTLTAKAALVCVSLGGKGALLVTSNSVLRGQPVRVKARGTVGAGDSMVGAMTAQLLSHGLTLPEHIDQTAPSILKEVLAWGLAAGAATAATEGSSLGTGAQIRKLYRTQARSRIADIPI